MNRFIHKVFITTSVLLCLLLGSHGAVASSSLSDEKEAQEFIDNVIPKIIARWDASQFTKFAHPEFFKVTSRDQLKQVFFFYSQLGPMKEYKGAKGQVVISKASYGVEKAVGNYVAQVDFENGPATIRVSIVKEKTGWNIIGFQVNSEIFDSPTVATDEVVETESDLNSLSEEELAAQANELLAENIIQLRHDIDKIFSIAAFYVEKGDIEKGIQLYQKALDADPANLLQQLRLAELLMNNGRQKEASVKLKFVYELAEDEKLIQDAKELLAKTGYEIPSPAAPRAGNDDNEIVLIPLGCPNRQVMNELRVMLQDKMGMRVFISDKAMELGTADRKGADRYVSKVFNNLIVQLTEVQKDMLYSELGFDSKDSLSTNNKSRFILTALAMSGRQGKIARQRFEENLKELGDKGQYQVYRLADELRKAFPFDRDEKVKAYIAVTPKDLYADDNNFMYGGTGGAYGVISYYWFTAEANGEKQNRQRLVKRLLKQALSSTNFALGIPRCNTPYCARSFPNSLQEHDAKSEDLCQECQSRLDAYKAESWSDISAYEYLKLGERYAEENKFDKAIKSYQKAIKKGGQYTPYLYQRLGLAYKAQGDNAEAVTALKKFLEVKPERIPDEEVEPVYSLIGKYYLAEGKTEQAVEYFKGQLQINASSIDGLCNLGSAYMELERFYDAFVELGKAEDLDPSSALVKALLGAFHSKQGNVEEAIKYFEAALKTEPNKYTTQYNLGAELDRAGKKGKAKEHYRKAIEINPSFAPPYKNLGVIYGQEGKLDKSLQMFEAASKIKPGDPQVWNDLGYTCYLKKLYTTALSYYERSLSLDPESGLAHYNKALAHYALQEFGKAIYHYDKAVEYNYAGSQKFRKALEAHRK